MKHLRITVEGKTYEVEVEVVGEADPVSNRVVNRPQPVRSAPAASSRPAPVAPPPVAAAKPAAAPAAAGEGTVASPLAALVVSIDVSLGQVVAEGDRLVTLEAMKMNTIVNAPRGGKVTAIHVVAADGVDEGQPLLTLE